MTKRSGESHSLTERLWKASWLLAASLLAFAAPDRVAGQAIDTNRPGFSFSPNVVERGQWQLETGINYVWSDSDTNTTSLPAAEVRIGVADHLEIFLSSLGWSKTRSADGDASGLVDMALGSKVNISNAKAGTLMALLFQLSVPVGDDNFSSDRWDPSIAFIWSCSCDLAIAGTVKISEFRSGYQLDNGLKLPFSLGEAGSAFVEWEANLPEGGGSSHWLNGGYQWLIEHRMQLDFNAGLGLNGRAGDYRLGIGFSIRL